MDALAPAQGRAPAVDRAPLDRTCLGALGPALVAVQPARCARSVHTVQGVPTGAKGPALRAPRAPTDYPDRGAQGHP